MRPDAPLRFEPVTAEHYPMLRVWLGRPHMREWWGDSEDELGLIVDMVEGRDTTRPYLIVLGERPVGYIQCWYVGHHQNDSWLKDNPWLGELAADAVGVDVSIGEPELLSQGIGSRAVADFAAMLAGEGHATIIIDPDPENHRAVRAYEKAGFQVIPHLVGRTEGVLLMQFDTKLPAQAQPDGRTPA